MKKLIILIAAMLLLVAGRPPRQPLPGDDIAHEVAVGAQMVEEAREGGVREHMSYEQFSGDGQAGQGILCRGGQHREAVTV